MRILVQAEIKKDKLISFHYFVFPSPCFFFLFFSFKKKKEKEKSNSETNYFFAKHKIIFCSLPHMLSLYKYRPNTKDLKRKTRFISSLK